MLGQDAERIAEVSRKALQAVEDALGADDTTTRLAAAKVWLAFVAKTAAQLPDAPPATPPAPRIDPEERNRRLRLLGGATGSSHAEG